MDFYDESWLIWLEADSVIRRQTGGKKSLDDFCRSFHGAPSTGPKLVTYTFDDVETAMNSIAPYDWRKFFRDRLDYIGPRAPLGGIEGGGWKLVYNETPNDHIQAADRVSGEITMEYSLGMNVGRDGAVLDVVPGMAAAESGLAPGMRLQTINGKAWSAEALHDAVRSTKGGGAPIELVADNDGFSKPYHVTYRGGELYPHLARIEGQPDILSDILKSLTPVTSAK